MMLIGYVVIRVRLVKSIFRGSRLNGFSAELGSLTTKKNPKGRDDERG